MSSDNLTFDGIVMKYQIKKPDEYRIAYYKHCYRTPFKVVLAKQENVVRGTVLEKACETLEQLGHLKIPLVLEDRVAMFRALGFSVETGADDRGDEFIVIFNK